jgi:hypothetical protein
VGSFILAFVYLHFLSSVLGLLKDSPYLDELDHIADCFDRTTKIRFSDDTIAQYIKFGSTKDRDDEVGIRFGQLKLSGHDVATFFAESVKCITGAVGEMLRTNACSLKVSVLATFVNPSKWTPLSRPAACSSGWWIWCLGVATQRATEEVAPSWLDSHATRVICVRLNPADPSPSRPSSRADQPGQ